MVTLKRDGTILNGTVMLPSSKSISNRLLILQYLHPRKVLATNLSTAEDTLLLESLLHRLRDYMMAGHSRVLSIDVGNSGTVMRFMTALLSSLPGSYVVSGDKRMHERPVRSLVEALTELGGDIQYLEEIGFLPLYIKGHHPLPGEVRVDASESSQHVSAILLISTMLSDGLRVILENEPVSRPYIGMTCKILDQCGFPAIWQEELIRVFPGKKKKVEIAVEPDWSSAAFWYGMMALASDGEVLFPGLKRSGLQGDETAAELFSHLGVMTQDVDSGILISKSEPVKGEFQWDFRNCPDLAPPAIVSCALLGIQAVFTGLKGLRLKESDRILALKEVLSAFNCELVNEQGDVWLLKPGALSTKMIVAHSHDDHRILMAIALASMRGLVLEVPDPEVVSKSYPGFWRDLKMLGFEVS